MDSPAIRPIRKPRRRIISPGPDDSSLVDNDLEEGGGDTPADTYVGQCHFLFSSVLPLLLPLLLKLVYFINASFSFVFSSSKQRGLRRYRI